MLTSTCVFTASQPGLGHKVLALMFALNFAIDVNGRSLTFGNCGAIPLTHYHRLLGSSVEAVQLVG